MFYFLKLEISKIMVSERTSSVDSQTVWTTDS